MPDTETYEVLIIGSGEAGKYLAWTMGKAGHRTAVVERKLIGGSCPNIACLASKNMIHSAKVASFGRRGAGAEKNSVWSLTRFASIWSAFNAERGRWFKT
jgi:pyruvate/2-oxoglutarate dehydrogenase complex dihydrolipoamide dehydrogenase (E3) component